MGLSVFPSNSDFRLLAALQIAPSAGTTAGIYTQVAGIPPAGITLGDIFRWTGTVAILLRVYANAPAAVDIAGQAHVKSPAPVYWSREPFSVTEALTFSATVTAPTKPAARVLDIITLTDEGNGWCSCDMVWSSNNVAGSNNGNGVFGIALPNGGKFDLNAHPVNTQALTGGGAFTASDQYKSLPQSDGVVSDLGGANVNRVIAVPRSATTFSIVTTAVLAGAVPVNTFWSSAFWGMVSFCRVSFRFKKG